MTKKKDKPKPRKKLFSGGMPSFLTHARMYELLRQDYVVVTYGSVKELLHGKNTLRFVTAQGGDRRIGACCRSVLEDVREFEEDNKPIESEKRTTFYKNSGLFTEYIMKGGREVCLVDVKRCYWTIVHKAGVISKKVYETYKDDKVLRLMAIGNLNKRKTVVEYRKGKRYSEDTQDNAHAWVWDLVVFKAYEMFEAVNKYSGGKVFMFKTDCMYVAPEQLQTTCKMINSLGYDYSVEYKNVVGRSGSQVVMADNVGRVRGYSFGGTYGLKMFLSEVDLPSQAEQDEFLEDDE
ncbi:MAG: hypothetical protein COA79_26090 [Planctomycetota bacterium]|nr:MAG: hypothetical protein COA79_26090 [Planctomycetota bacterium]